MMRPLSLLFLALSTVAKNDCLKKHNTLAADSLPGQIDYDDETGEFTYTKPRIETGKFISDEDILRSGLIEDGRIKISEIEYCLINIDDRRSKLTSLRLSVKDIKTYTSARDIVMSTIGKKDSKNCSKMELSS
jgi:hypothetical protein